MIKENCQCFITLSAEEVLAAITAFHSLPPDANILFKFKKDKFPKIEGSLLSEVEFSIFDGVSVSY